jgi:hypothetical protein
MAAVQQRVLNWLYSVLTLVSRRLTHPGGAAPGHVLVKTNARRRNTRTSIELTVM